MKKYIKPEIEEEVVVLEDVIAASTVELNSIWYDGDDDFGNGSTNS